MEIQYQSKLLHSAGMSIFIWLFYINYQSDIIDHLHLIWDENVIEKTKSFFKSLNLIIADKTALILLLLLNLFSPDRSELNERHKIMLFQTKYSFLLKKYMSWKFGK